jgi:UDP-N-acetylmuramate: L-alanyl-gamma-D-glutamyl-meso-diaminopimelate ligase
VLEQGHRVATVHWEVGGVHNQLNALAAIAAAQHVGVTPATAATALREFRNVKRRMEVLGIANGVTVYDDFAHHPTAIRTTIDGLRRQVGAQRILAVFEPRSNTMKLGTMKAQLPWSLEQADLSFCHAGGLGWDPAETLKPMGKKALIGRDIAELVEQVGAAARPGDHVLCMSNGGFGGIHAKLLERLGGAH